MAELLLGVVLGLAPAAALLVLGHWLLARRGEPCPYCGRRGGCESAGTWNGWEWRSCRRCGGEWGVDRWGGDGAGQVAPAGGR